MAFKKKSSCCQLEDADPGKLTFALVIRVQEVTGLSVKISFKCGGTPTTVVACGLHVYMGGIFFNAVSSPLSFPDVRFARTKCKENIKTTVKIFQR
jgi:hypothetical protein